MCQSACAVPPPPFRSLYVYSLYGTIAHWKDVYEHMSIPNEAFRRLKEARFKLNPVDW